MKLKFKQQEYQNDAVKSIVDCFKNQPKLDQNKSLAYHKGTIDIISFSNPEIKIDDAQRIDNIEEVQKYNKIYQSNKTIDKNNLDEFTIEMETGTGKTYTYIKAMYELNKSYGWSKYIVMVPSIAIREGVLKSFKITEDHFQEQYQKKVRYFVYDSSNPSLISNIDSFASSSDIQVMIINYQAFNSNSKDNNRIFRELDEMGTRSPIDVIKEANPILIIDEPQKFGPKANEALKGFNPLFKLRFSATHKENEVFNQVYRLDAIDAYNQKLVKKIGVKSVELINNKSEGAYLYLDKIEISKSNPVAYIEMEQKVKTGIKKIRKKIEVNDNLYEISKNLAAYRGYIVSEINARVNKVYFTNGEEISVGDISGDVDLIYLTRLQIRETIKSHFEKEQDLYIKGIKVLSLFFIDKVSNYKGYDKNNNEIVGEYAKIFEEEYNKELRNVLLRSNNHLYNKYLDDMKDKKIHSGYFSIDKGKVVDTKIAQAKELKEENLGDDKDAFDLIMRDKERLLSLEEPVRFIFSHSALREGWDNPNVFQICTLNKTTSEMKKRQEVGRGLRICVNSNGERMDESYLEEEFHQINKLTVIANESYEEFATKLQNEILESIGGRPKSINADFISKLKLSDLDGKNIKLDNNEASDLLFDLVENEYVDRKNNYTITEKLVYDLTNNDFKISKEFGYIKESIETTFKYLFTSIPIENENKITKNSIDLNENFKRKEFQELWNKINVKSSYLVDFDSDELIENCIKEINDDKFKVNRMIAKVSYGEQKDELSESDLAIGEAMENPKTNKPEELEEEALSTIKYDLVGEIANNTKLTRKTIVKILTGIKEEKFNEFKLNPDDFIIKITNIINEQKGSVIINGISYHKLEDRYDSDIFTLTNIGGILDKNMFKQEKHIYDYLITRESVDSKTEADFAKRLDEHNEVLIYAKLPAGKNGFKIPTPMGNYSPDWAIVFDDNDANIQYVYFVAETKGNISSMQLRPIEDAKIECAKKHFKAITEGESKIKYDVVDSYEKLYSIVRGQKSIEKRASDD